YTNERGNSAEADPTRFQWTYTTDRMGYETSMTAPSQIDLSQSVSQNVLDASRATWKYDRDRDGMMTAKTEPAGSGGFASNLPALVTHYDYDDHGNLLKITYPQQKAD